MNDKYTLKIIHYGKTQQIRTVQAGGGITGNAVVIKAEDATRFQIVNAVTLISPPKLQMKRSGADLHIALLGGDLDAPDLLIQNYFIASGVSMQGAAPSGEWMAYDISSLVDRSVGDGVGTLNGVQPLVDKSSIVSLGSGTGLFDSPWLWAAGVVGAAALGSGGGGGNGTVVETTPLAAIQAYAGGGGTTAPTAAQYTSAGLTLPVISGVTTANVLAAMNAVVASKASADVATLAQLQTLASSLSAAYTKILAEANGAVADATPGVDPTLTDYANVGVAVGATTQSLALMNSALGEMVVTGVDSVAKLKLLATASENVMKVSSGVSGATLTNADLVSLGLKINGINGGITTTEAAAFEANLSNLETGLGLTESLSTGAATNSLAKLQALFSLQILRSFNDDPAAIGSKGQAAPGISDYSAIGVKSYQGLTNTSSASRIDLVDANFSSVPGFSLQTTLNSALDKLASGTALTKTVIQSMVDSYYRILKEADGKFIGDANGGAIYYDGSSIAKTADTDVYADSVNDPAGAGSDPLASDYANVGVTKVDGTALTVSNASNTAVLALLNNAVGRFTTTKVDTTAELSALEKAAENVFALSSGGALGAVSYTGTTADTDWVDGLTALGVVGVTTTNIAAVKTAIDITDSSNNGTAVDSVVELQDIVSLVRMKAFTDDVGVLGSKNVATPTLSDWGALVDVNTSLLDSALINLDAATYWKSSNTINGINALNSALDSYAGTAVTTAQLKTIADAYGRVLQEADGNRVYNTDVSKVDNSVNADLVAADLASLNVSFLNTPGVVTPASAATTLASEKSLLLSTIGGLSSTAVDTLSELNELAKIADNVVKQAAGGVGGNAVTYLDSEWISSLSSFGLTGVNSSNIAAVKTAISATADDGTGVDSYNELQSLVSQIRINDFAALNTGYTLPTIEDYQACVAQYGTATDQTQYALTAVGGVNAGGAFLAYSNANSAYLASYNDAVNYGSTFTGIEIKDLVLAYNSILNEANGTAVDQTTYDPLAADYRAVGVGTGTSINSNILNMLGVSEYVNLLTDVVAAKSTSQVDQVSELNGLASIIVKIQDLEAKTVTGSAASYTGITGGALQVSELTALGLDTSNLTNTAYGVAVLSNRLNDVYDHIIAVDHTSAISRSTIDSLNELQTLINNTNGIVI